MKRNRQEGFILLEILILLILVGLFLAAMGPNLVSQMQQAHEDQVYQGVHRLIQAELQYAANYGSYPINANFLSACSNSGVPNNQHACLISPALTSSNGAVILFQYNINTVRTTDGFLVYAVPVNKYAGRLTFCGFDSNLPTLGRDHYVRAAVGLINTDGTTAQCFSSTKPWADTDIGSKGDAGAAGGPGAPGAPGTPGKDAPPCSDIGGAGAPGANGFGGSPAGVLPTNGNSGSAGGTATGCAGAGGGGGGAGGGGGGGKQGPAGVFVSSSIAGGAYPLSAPCDINFSNCSTQGSLIWLSPVIVNSMSVSSGTYSISASVQTTLLSQNVLTCNIYADGSQVAQNSWTAGQSNAITGVLYVSANVPVSSTISLSCSGSGSLGSNGTYSPNQPSVGSSLLTANQTQSL